MCDWRLSLWQHSTALMSRDPKTSLREKIYEELRRDIVCGVYKDHEELKENAVARHYQVSRTPVREAFRLAGTGRAGNDRAE